MERIQSLGNQNCLELDNKLRLVNGTVGMARTPGSGAGRLTGQTAPAEEQRGSPRVPHESLCAGACLTFPAGLVVAAGHGGG